MTDTGMPTHPRWLISQWLAAFVGLALVVAAFFVPVEYTQTGGRTLEGWWVAMLGVSGAIAGTTWPTTWRKAGSLSALFILGMTAQLGITYPHWTMSLRVIPDEFQRPEQYLSAAVLVLQGLVALALSLPHLRSLARFSASALSPARSLALVAIFLFSAANVAAYYPQVFQGGYATELYARWLVGAAAILTVNLLLLWQIGLAMPSEPLAVISARASRLISLPGDRGPAKRLDAPLLWCLVALVPVVTVFFGRVVLKGTAQFGDEVMYQFMANVFASGSLRVPAPPIPAAFEMYMVEVRDGMRFGVAVPGWPMVLALGAFFGVPWLVNPVLGALSIVVGHKLATRLADRGTANVVALFMATSPWFLILSSVYQPHAITLLAALITWLAIHHAKSNGKQLWALLGGLAAGVAFSVRPLDGLVIGGAGAIYAASKISGGRASAGVLLMYVAGCVGTGSISLWINYALTGNPLTYPMNAYFDRAWSPGANRLGFGPDVGQVWGVLDPIPGHGWRDVLFNLNLNVFTLNYELMGWGVGSLFLLTVHLVWGRLTSMDRAWLAFMVGAVALYSLYWFNGGPDYGPRYWYSMLFPLVLLSARGLTTLVDVVRERVPSRNSGSRIGLVVVFLCLSGVGVYGPWRVVAKYLDYRSKTSLFRESMDAGAFSDDGLVIVDADGEGEYAALELNELIPGQQGPVFARDLGPESNLALIEAFPDRPVYRATLRIMPDGKKAIAVTPVQRPPLAGPRG